MIGQTQLLNKLNTYTLATLPKTLLFLGEEGCGKQTVVQYIASKFDMPIVAIEDGLDPELIIEYQQSPIATIYTINLDTFTEKAQNQFLKFIEEPGRNVYLMLRASSELNILETVLNRCLKIHFDPYTEAELRQIKNYQEDVVYKICHTPGQVLSIDNKNLLRMESFCKTTINIIDKLGYCDLLAVSTEINYKDDYTKFDFKNFLQMMQYVSLQAYIESGRPVYYTVYDITRDKLQELVGKSVQKEQFIIEYLTDLWKKVKEG